VRGEERNGKLENGRAIEDIYICSKVFFFFDK
jgi:hypothetical protein